MSINLRSVPGGPAQLPPPADTATEEQQRAEAERQDLKSTKQAKSDVASETRGQETQDAAGTAKHGVESVAHTAAIARSVALIEALASGGVVADAMTLEQGKNDALAVFETFVPRLGKPTGALAKEFSARPQTSRPLEHVPSPLLAESAWQELSDRLAHNPAPSPADISPVITALAKALGGEARLDPKAIAALPGPWAKYAKVVAAFWRHDKQALLEANPPSAAMKQALTPLAPHLEKLAAAMRSYYAPAIKGCKTITRAADAPVLPDALTEEMERALGVSSLNEAGLRIATLAKSPAELASFKTALAAAMKGTEAPEASAAMRTLASAVAPQVNAISHALSEGGDIDALIWLVMMESTKLEESLLRDQMKEMQKQNALKKAQREKIAVMREGEARMKTQMAEEFHMLQATGEIHSSITLEQYQTWRQVAWGDGVINEDGTFTGPKPTLPPRPAIPSWLKTGNAASKSSGGADAFTKYGLDADVTAKLQSMYDALPPPKATFDTWLSQTIGLKEVTARGKEGVDAIIANYKKLQQVLGKPEALTKPPETSGVSLDPDYASDPGAPLRKAEALAEQLAIAQVMQLDPRTLDNRKKALEEQLSKLNDTDCTTFKEFVELDLQDMVRRFGVAVRNGLDSVVHGVQQAWEGDDDRDTHNNFLIDGNGNLLIYVNDDEGDHDDWEGYAAVKDLLAQGRATGGFWETATNVLSGVAAFALGGPLGVAAIGGAAAAGHTAGGAFWPHDPGDPNWKPENALGTFLGIVKSYGQERKNEDINALIDKLKRGEGISVPIPERATAKPVDYAAFNQDASAAKSAITDELRALEAISTMPRNPDGSFYGPIPPGAEEAFAALEASGKIKRGKSPDELRKEAAEKAAAERELKEFMQNGGEGKAASVAMRLNHQGSLAELGAAVENEKANLDSMSELGTLESMRLQQMMERRSKAIEMLSNIMKKMAQVSDSIVANYK